MRRNQIVIKNDNDQLVAKKYPKKKQPNIHPLPNCPSCKRKNWLELDKGYYCKKCEYMFNRQRHQIDKNLLRQDHDFSTRLNYANQKLGKIWINLVNTTYISTEGMIDKIKQLKGKTKLKFYKNISNYYDEKKRKNFQTREDPSYKNAHGLSKTYYDVLLLLKYLQTKPEGKNLNFFSNFIILLLKLEMKIRT